MYEIRTATGSEIERIMEIYAYAQEVMIQNGNPTQWGHFYPARELILRDISEGACKVILENGEIHGVFAACTGEEPFYGKIYEGAWLNNEDYVTIHRIAGDGKLHGLLSAATEYCRQNGLDIRIDTHADNKIMQHLIEKAGFQKCGIVYVEDGTPRIAYQMTNGFYIRRAQETECDKILYFIRQLAEYEKMPQEVVATEDLLREWIFDKKKAEVLFACCGGKEIGFALYFHNFSTFLGRAGIYLEDLFILPEYRGHGYGTAMLKKLAQTAVEEGCGRLEWWCLDWNQPSINLYLSLGAVPMDEWTTYRLTGDALKKLAEKR